MTRVLVLVPTEFELRKLQPFIAEAVATANGTIATCGFGPIVSGIKTTQLLAHHTPTKVVLAGITGAIGPRFSIGTAASFSQLACYGIGAGSGSGFQTASELGWNRWNEATATQGSQDVLQLHGDPASFRPWRSDSQADSGDASDNSIDEPLLLTVCAASANSTDVADRLKKFPQAAAEDMEAYSVAMACRMANVPLTVIRGISNLAGDRNKAQWNVDAALKAVATWFTPDNLS
jgi:futalosine hydrolase